MLRGLALVAWLGPAPADSVSVRTGRIAELRAMPQAGTPVESILWLEGRGAPPAAGTAAAPRGSSTPDADPADRALYVRAAIADGEGRWREAASLYHQSTVERGRLERGRWGREGLAREKAELERQRSLVLESLAQARAPGGDARAPGFVLERARLLRLKLMSVRAATGAVSQTLFRAARDGFREALRGLRDRKLPGEAEARLLLGATVVVGGEREEGRIELAHVRQADRDDPQNALALATCLAALGENDAALERLEAAVRRADPGPAREVYLRNDWDRLRGDRRFERLFGF